MLPARNGYQTRRWPAQDKEEWPVKDGVRQITLWCDQLTKAESANPVLSTILLLNVGGSFYSCCYYGLAYVVRSRDRFSPVERYPFEITPAGWVAPAPRSQRS
jgi:hypothetical protein